MFQKNVSMVLSSLLLANFTFAQEISLHSGWQLKGSDSVFTSMAQFDNSCIATVWAYNSLEHRWDAYSPDTNLQNIINNSLTLKPLSAIQANEGFWVLGKCDTTIATSNSSSFATSTSFSSSSSSTYVPYVPPYSSSSSMSYSSTASSSSSSSSSSQASTETTTIQLVSTDATTTMSVSTIQLTTAEIASLQSAINANTSSDYNISFANNTITISDIDTVNYNATVTSIWLYDSQLSSSLSSTSHSSVSSSSSYSGPYLEPTPIYQRHAFNITNYKTLYLSVKFEMLPTQHNVTNTTELRAALLSAAQNGKTDVINIADGTYKTTDDGQGAFVFLDNESYSLTLKGSNSGNVILSGDNVHQVLSHRTVNTTSLLVLNNISIVDGNSTDYTGGGVNTSEDINVTGCTFDNNKPYGLLVTGYGTIADSTFTRNGTGANISKLQKVINSTFDSNDGDGLQGNSNGVYPTSPIQDSTFSNNGGVGFYNYYSRYIISESSFSGNQQGGLNAQQGTITINNSIFKDNNVSNDGYGGGLTASEATIANSIFENNRNTSYYSSKGGAMYIGSSLTMTNSLLINNKANEGSGVYISNGEASNIVNSVFIDNNSTDVAGGTSAVVGIYNNYLDIANIDITSFKVNNIFVDVTLGFIDEANRDYHLTSTSSLINAGTSLISGVTIPTTDLDGNPRTVGSAVDIGPYEFQ